ncbi:hypothetical protein SLITO_v1c06570 [Spiroplasma litorale]|uniref:Uncharacterized protein n=1 Tax=Spiroplasma litorale TaxID=216942 RepID=A0A0K1W291_9MOLU|nr:hypothetical protein [Spiroplasma litorale]AKX34286.1 hypothetical protein SLITO_v1c06570 [Spiroplasma litorale]
MSLLLKYAGLEKIVHIECQRINLFQDINDGAFIDLGDINGSEEHETLKDVLDKWNNKEETKKYQLTENNVKLDYFDEENYIGPKFVSTYNPDSPYSNFIQLNYNFIKN